MFFLFAMPGCSKKGTTRSQEQSLKKETETQSYDIKAKDQLLRSMHKEIENFNKLSPDELAEKERGLEELHKKSRQKALEMVIARFDNIKKGALANEVETVFRSIGKHQFTVERDGKAYSCFSYYIGKEYWAKRAAKYYCVYENSFLERIVVPPPFEYDYIPYKNGTRGIRKPIDPDKRINETFRAKNLLNQGLIDSLIERFPEKSSSLNLGPLIGILGIFSDAGEKRKEKDDFKREKLEKKYNSAAIKLGMNIADIKAVLGSAKDIHNQNSKLVRVYGEEATFIYYPYSLPWIAVEYENEKVIRVLTRDFFDQGEN